jgi:hypothetical protein
MQGLRCDILLVQQTVGGFDLDRSVGGMPEGTPARLGLRAGGGQRTYEFFATWLSCTGAGDHGWFCVPRIDLEMRQARSLESSSPRDAACFWARIDREIVDRAALVPLVNPRQVDFVSARVRNFQHHSYLGFIADQVWLR